MELYRLQGRLFLRAVFILMMIQGITSLPHKWDSYYAGSGYAFSNPEPPSEIQVSRLDGNSPNPRPSIQEKRPALNRGKAPISDSRIVFPTDRIDHHIEKLPLSVVPICQGKTFCEETPYYPEDLLDNVIGKAEEFRFLSGVDVVSDVVQRIDVSDDTPLCVSNEQVVYPQSAENQNKEWLFVVNHRNFTQGVRIETCSNVDGECSIFEGFAEGYRTTCKQKYIYRQLAAIAPNGSIKSDMFRFPSSCCCHVKFLGSPLVRMRISLAKSNFTAALKKKLE